MTLLIKQTSKFMRLLNAVCADQILPNLLAAAFSAYPKVPSRGRAHLGIAVSPLFIGDDSQCFQIAC